ncbi:MAG: ppa [Proteobacteria bacterium]|nr:ppa [Pseudomonadota bacterium]
MDISKISSGLNVPDDINVIIEIPANAAPIKYEHDKASGAIFVDRLMGTSMSYPLNYGYVPHTISGDGDPVDVLVATPFPLLPGVVIRCRPIGLLRMEDESGVDAKVLAVPLQKLTVLYDDVKSYTDMPLLLINQVAHFFEHYKDLEAGKWVKIRGWEDVEAARQEIIDGVAAYQANPVDPF